jgi:hypothetical protein
MKMRIIAGLAALLVTGCGSEKEAEVEAVFADTLYLGDNIITMSEAMPSATALAVLGGKIIGVGAAEDLEALKGEGTRVVELGSRALLPGFIDAHGHFLGQSGSLSLGNTAPPPVGTVNNFSDIQNVIAAYISDNAVPAGEWVIARGYDDSLLEEGTHPDKGLLDAVSPDNPVFVAHVSGHMAVLNTAALALLGIDETTPTPEGGEITRYEGTQEPTGLVKETALWQVRAQMPAPDPAKTIAGLASAFAYYASMGITSVQDGGTTPGAVKLLEAAAAAGQLTMDVTAFPHAGSHTLEELLAYEYGAYSAGLKLGGVKFMLDGSPQGKTAWLSHPYHVPPAGEDADYRGYGQVGTDILVEKLTALYGQGVPVLAHANGDAASEQLVSAAEAAAAVHPGDHRTVMIHAQTVRDDQLDRMKVLGMIPSYFAAHSFYWGDWHRDSVLGLERSYRISPAASTVERDMPFTVHNDAPVVPPDMMRLVWATVNRRTRTGDILGPDQRVDVMDALRAVTVYAAYQNFEEDTKGSLEVGKYADLVILAEDPRAVEPGHLKDIKISQTVFRGKTVFGGE